MRVRLHLHQAGVDFPSAASFYTLRRWSLGFRRWTRSRTRQVPVGRERADGDTRVRADRSSADGAAAAADGQGAPRQAEVSVVLAVEVDQVGVVEPARAGKS
jgi:hypothetical protein